MEAQKEAGGQEQKCWPTLRCIQPNRRHSQRILSSLTHKHKPPLREALSVGKKGIIIVRLFSLSLQRIIMERRTLRAYIIQDTYHGIYIKGPEGLFFFFFFLFYCIKSFIISPGGNGLAADGISFRHRIKFAWEDVQAQ